MGSWYDRDEIVTEMKQHDFDRVAVAKIVGCSTRTITRQMQVAAGIEGKPYTNQKIRGQKAADKPRIRWNSEALMKLTSILARDPLPPHAAIAFEMGVTKPALWTALSRFGLSPKVMSNNVKHPKDQRPRGTGHRKLRSCMCCGKPFGSYGINNRLCQGCKREEFVMTRKFTDAQAMVALKAIPPHSRSRYASLALLLDCHIDTAREYAMRIERPQEYAKWLKIQKEKGYRWRGSHNQTHRKAPMSPTQGEIQIALKATDGDAYAAARILGCSKTPVRAYILAERAAGRSCGRYRNRGVQIAVPIDDTLPPVPLTEEDHTIIALTESYMADELELAA